MSEQKNSMGMDEKTASWFAYVLAILSAIIVLVSEKDNKTVRTHAWQSLVMGCFFVAVLIILGILSAIFMPNPLVNPMAYLYGPPVMVVIFGIISWIAGVLWVVLTIMCILKALQGDIFKVPVIYDKVQNFK